jgi:hypothetical protein
MEQPSIFSKILRKLFIPLKFKLPVELAGAALAALLVFSVFTLQHEEYKVAQAPRALKREETGEKRLTDKAAVPSENTTRRAPGTKKELLIECTLLLGKSAEPLPGQAFEAPAPEKKLKASQAANQAAPAPKAEKENVVGANLVPVTRAIEAAQGRILSVGNAKQQGQPTFILAEVPSDKLRSLVDNLRQLGKVHVPPSIPFDEVQGPVKIRVRIVADE